MKTNPSDFSIRKKAGENITMVTGYDFPGARLLDDCGVDIVLVGDSLGTNVLGYDAPTEVTMDDMLHHVRAVARGVRRSFVLADMPFGSIDTPDTAIDNALSLMSAGADGVKMEGGQEIINRVRSVVNRGIAVCGHIGFMPQTGGKPGIVGKTFTEAKDLIVSALALQEAGVCMIVLELMPQHLAAEITRLLVIPTIGIGAGPSCDGQVQVYHDMLGLYLLAFSAMLRIMPAEGRHSPAPSAGISQMSTPVRFLRNQTRLPCPKTFWRKSGNGFETTCREYPTFSRHISNSHLNHFRNNSRSRFG